MGDAHCHCPHDDYIAPMMTTICFSFLKRFKMKIRSEKDVIGIYVQQIGRVATYPLPRIVDLYKGWPVSRKFRHSVVGPHPPPPPHYKNFFMLWVRANPRAQQHSDGKSRKCALLDNPWCAGTSRMPEYSPWILVGHSPKLRIIHHFPRRKSTMAVEVPPYTTRWVELPYLNN